MPLEDLTGPNKFLDALNTAWPLDDDDRPEGDDHIRGIKNVLVNQFGAASAATPVEELVAWNEPAAGAGVKTGSLPMAVGTTAERPSGNERVRDWRFNSDLKCVEEWNGTTWVPNFARRNYINHFAERQVFEAAADILASAYLSAAPGEGTQDVAQIRWALAGADGGRIQLRRRLIAGAMQTFLENNANDATYPGDLLLSNCPQYRVEGSPIFRGVFDEQEYQLSAGDEGTRITLPHNLGVRPQLAQLSLQCVNNNNNWVAGNEVIFNSYGNARVDTNAADQGAWAFQPDTNNFRISVGSKAASNTVLPNRNNGQPFSITLSDWKLVARGWVFSGLATEAAAEAV